MSILSSEIIFYLTGGADNTDPDASLGGAPNFTTGEITTDELNNLFDDVGAEESEAGDIEYRCIAVKNTNATIDMLLSKMFMLTQPAQSTITIAFEEPATDAVQIIANESTAPITVSFSAPSTYATGIAVNSEAVASGTVTKAKWFGVWIKRTVTAEALAQANDYFEVKVQGATT